MRSSLTLSLVLAGMLALAVGPAVASPPADAAADASAAEPSGDKERPVQQAAVDTAADAGKNEFKPPEGFKKRIRNGKEVYCRKSAPAGSRIERTECFSEAQVAAIEQAQRAFRDDMRNQGLICADQRCNGS